MTRLDNLGSMIQLDQPGIYDKLGSMTQLDNLGSMTQLDQPGMAAYDNGCKL